MRSGREADNEEFSLSFSNYCGLGGYGIPQHEVDKICKKHDANYATIQQQRGTLWPYFNYNWADELMLQMLRNRLKEHGVDMLQRERIVGNVANKFFEIKKHFANKKQEQLQQEEEEDLQIGIAFVEGTHGSLSNSPSNDNMGKSFINLRWQHEEETTATTTNQKQPTTPSTYMETLSALINMALV